MATVSYELESVDGWTEVAADGTDYLIENQGDFTILVTQQDSAPGVDAAYHRLLSGESMIRIGSGAAYIKAPEGFEIVAVVTT